MSVRMRIYQARRGRSGTEQPEMDYDVERLTWTASWGSQPGGGTAVFALDAGKVAADPNFGRVDLGAWVELEVYGRKFYGVCVAGPGVTGGTGEGAGQVVATDVGVDGAKVAASFADERVYLGWDVVFGAFNMEEARMVGGVRVKRYWHLYPRDYAESRKTWTEEPLRASQILDALFGAETVETGWRRVYHAAQDLYPIYNVDFMGGRRLDEALAELSEAQGLVMTTGVAARGAGFPAGTHGRVITGSAFELVWMRKGDGPAAVIPAGVGRKGVEVKLGEGPSRVWVVGGRNVYLCLDLTLEPDWNRNYEELLKGGGLDGLTIDLYGHHAEYNAIAGDTEHAQGWFLAAARAKEITVREYAAERLGRDGKDFGDGRLYGGRSRMEMPVALYLSELVFRAYRPPGQVQIGPASVDVRSLRAAGEMFAKVTHNVESGEMTAAVSGGGGEVAVEEPGVGNGYVIVQGVGLDPAHLVEMFAPERFSPSAWGNATSLWRPMSFALDESGEDGGFIVLDEACWKSGDVFQVVDGHGVLKANPTLEPAGVRAALAFEGDRFRVGVGVAGGRDEVMQVGAIRREVVVKGGSVVGEVLYGDGKRAAEKAEEVGGVRLGMPWAVVNGEYERPLNPVGDSVPALSGMIHRVTAEISGRGHFVKVEFAGERGRRSYVPDADLDRMARNGGLFNGQKELRALAAMDRFQAAEARRTSGAMAGMVGQLLRGRGGVEGRIGRVTVQSGAGPLAAGTPLWRGPLSASATAAEGGGGGGVTLSGTQAVMPAAAGSGHTVLAGVVVREGEDAGGLVAVAEEGRRMARVKGPCQAGDTVGRVNGQDYLMKVGGGANGEGVGRVEQAVLSGEVRLVRVWLGVGGTSAGGARAVWH